MPPFFNIYQQLKVRLAGKNKHPPKLHHQGMPDEQPGVHRHKKIGQVQKTPCRFRPVRCKSHQQGLCDIGQDAFEKFPKLGYID